jgi:hypothetical protein
LAAITSLSSLADDHSDPGLRIVFELVEGNADAFAMRFAEALIAADRRGQRDRLGSRECPIPPGTVLHRLDGFAVCILIFLRRSLTREAK